MLVGDRIGDWIVGPRLGSGGMGTVYRCHGTLSEQVVAAIKVLYSPTPALRSRFIREVEILASLDHHPTVLTTRAERAVAKTLEADCQSPVAAYATIDGDELTVTALVALPDGSRWLRDAVSGVAEDAETLGKTVARRLLDAGAADILATPGQRDG